jgi:hypothetical protein
LRYDKWVRVWGLGFGVWDPASRAWDLGFWIYNLRVRGSGLSGLGFRIWGDHARDSEGVARGRVVVGDVEMRSAGEVVQCVQV